VSVAHCGNHIVDVVRVMHHPVAVPTIITINGVKIMIFADDHNPPHFHARFGEHVAQIRIADLAVINGSLPRAKLQTVVTWAGMNQAMLAAHWARLTGGTE